MYRLLPNKTYCLSGHTTNLDSQEQTDWIKTCFTVTPKSLYQLFISGFGYSKFRNEEYAFIIVGYYNIKTGMGKLCKQHLLSAVKEVENCKLFQLGSFQDYSLCVYNELSPITADSKDQSEYLQLHLSSDAAFGILSIVQTNEQVIYDKLGDETKQNETSLSEQEQQICDFYRRHTLVTADLSCVDRLYAEIIIPREKTWFYYRAGFTIENWNKNNENKKLLMAKG
jgi:hypothetical protein